MYRQAYLAVAPQGTQQPLLLYQTAAVTLTTANLEEVIWTAELTAPTVDMIGTMITESWAPYVALPSEEATALYMGTHPVELLEDWEDLEGILIPVLVQDCWLLLVAVIQEATVYVLNPNTYDTSRPANSLLD